ncbi:MAG: LysR family transcriptional regulator [Gemmatimonadota bacterium]
MELRHLRYFVAVAEQRSFLRAARHLRVAQPALSRQIRDLETTLGVTLFYRLPRGVSLTSAGEAFLTEARHTLQVAANAVAVARRADEAGTTTLHVAHGEEMATYSPHIADLISVFQQRHSEIGLRISYARQTELLAAVRSHDVDVAATFVMRWPEPGFEACRLRETSLTGVLLSATHLLAAQQSIHLRDLRDLTFLNRSSRHWPENYRQIVLALRERGVVPAQEADSSGAPSNSVELAAGNAWSLANEELAEQVVSRTKSVVFRPFVEPPIRSWLALIWLPGAPTRVQQFVDVARELFPMAAPSSAADAESDGGERLQPATAVA